MNYFIDTSALVALVLPEEKHHEHYMRTIEGMIALPAIHMVMTEYIIDEWYTLLRCKKKLPVSLILGFLEKIRPHIRIQPLNQNIITEAFSLLKKYDNHFLSFTDATTIIFMKKENIRHILTTDRDLQTFGFEIL